MVETPWLHTLAEREMPRRKTGESLSTHPRSAAPLDPIAATEPFVQRNTSLSARMGVVVGNVPEEKQTLRKPGKAELHVELSVV